MSSNARLTIFPTGYYHTAFFVGGKDEVLDGHRVRRYIQGHGVGAGFNWNPQGQHGELVGKLVG